MEKKGDILNQLAIISDLLEKANMESKTTIVTFALEEKEFHGVFNIVSKKVPRLIGNEIENTFSVKIGEIEFVFNMSSV